MSHHHAQCVSRTPGYHPQAAHSVCHIGIIIQYKTYVHCATNVYCATSKFRFTHVPLTSLHHFNPFCCLADMALMSHANSTYASSHRFLATTGHTPFQGPVQRTSCLNGLLHVAEASLPVFCYCTVYPHGRSRTVVIQGQQNTEGLVVSSEPSLTRLRLIDRAWMINMQLVDLADRVTLHAHNAVCN